MYVYIQVDTTKATIKSTIPDNKNNCNYITYNHRHQTCNHPQVHKIPDITSSFFLSPPSYSGFDLHNNTILKFLLLQLSYKTICNITFNKTIPLIIKLDFFFKYSVYYNFTKVCFKRSFFIFKKHTEETHLIYIHIYNIQTYILYIYIPPIYIINKPNSDLPLVHFISPNTNLLN